MKLASCLLVATVVGVTLAYTGQASALGPVDFEVGALAGYASNPFKFDPINPMGAGIGGRVGASFSHVYAGAMAMYYFGGSLTGTNRLTGASEKDSQDSLLYGIEAGYDFHISFLTLRPQIGFGRFTGRDSSSGTPQDVAHSLYVEPCARAIVSLGHVNFGVDLGVLWTPGLDDSLAPVDSHAEVVANGEVGVKF